MTTLKQMLKLLKAYQACKVFTYETNTGSMIPISSVRGADSLLSRWDVDVVIDWPVENIYPEYQKMADERFKIVMVIVIMKPSDYERTRK